MATWDGQNTQSPGSEEVGTDAPDMVRIVDSASVGGALMEKRRSPQSIDCKSQIYNFTATGKAI
jgi:hypothetical protein